jgi:hypothetical protein
VKIICPVLETEGRNARKSFSFYSENKTVVQKLLDAGHEAN